MALTAEDRAAFLERRALQRKVAGLPPLEQEWTDEEIEEAEAHGF